MSTAPTGYQTPKTDWEAGYEPTKDDFNRIEGNSDAIDTGSRTVDQAQNPSSNAGSLRQFIDWFANRIKAITGKTNWYDAPSKNLEDLNSHIGSGGTAHSSAIASGAAGFMTGNDKAKLDAATSAATVSALMARDGSGRAKVATPSATDDIARLDTVNNAVAAINNYATGNVAFTDSVPANSTLTKNIAMGGAYKRANLIMANTSQPNVSVRISCGANNLATFVEGGITLGASDQVGGAWSRRLLGAVVKGNFGRVYVGSYYTAAGQDNIEVSETYVSGSNIRQDFKNTHATLARSLGCEIDWEAWN